MLQPAILRVGVDPTIELGPLTLAWHGITIAAGILVGALVAARFARERGLDPEPLTTFAVLASLAGIAGARLLYLLESGEIADPAAYHSGGLYEVLLGAAIFALVWPLRHRLRRPTALAWIVLGLYGMGRFLESFLRLDSPELALGLTTAHASSLALLLAAGAGFLWSRRRFSAR